MNSVKYSIIIPNFNSGQLLGRLLESIPDREDIEVVVVDDKSTDGSVLRAINKYERNNLYALAAELETLA